MMSNETKNVVKTAIGKIPVDKENKITEKFGSFKKGTDIMEVYDTYLHFMSKISDEKSEKVME